MPESTGGALHQGTPQARLDLARRLSALAFKVPVADLSAPTRYSAPAARARQVAMYLAHVVLGLSFTAIGQAFGRDRSTVSYACGLIEEKRDNPQFDVLIGRLEMLLICTTHNRAASRPSNINREVSPSRPPSADVA